MSTAISPETLASHNEAVRKHLPRNFAAHGIEGGLYIGGLAFLSAQLVMPKMVESLGGAPWLIALMPQLLLIGYSLPPLLTAHLIERVHRLQPLLVTTGILQRLPYLLAGATLLLCGTSHPRLALAVVMVCPLLSSMIAGVSITAWQELVANTIPPKRRSSLWATRNIVSALIGVGAGVGIKEVLDHYPNATGYGLLHLICFGLIMVSYAVFLCIREVPNPRPRVEHKTSLADSLRLMPALIAGDRQLRRYLLLVIFGNGFGIMIPFLSIHFLHVLDKPESYLGITVMVQMFGSIAGNILGGGIGDKFGGKTVMGFGLIGMIAVCIWSIFARTSAEFTCVVFLQGATMLCCHIGRSTMNLEMAPLHQRIRYLALIAGAGLVSLLTTVTVSALAWKFSGGSFAVVAALAAAFLAVAAAILLTIHEPRKTGQSI